MCKKFICLSFILLLGLAGNASAVDCWWGGGDGNFMDPCNWSPQLPGSGDMAGININAMPQPTFSGATHTVGNVLVGFWNPGGMTMTSGDLTVESTMAVGYAGGAASTTHTSTFDMEGGTLSAMWFWIGSSAYTNWRNDGYMGVANGAVVNIGDCIAMGDNSVWEGGESAGFLTIDGTVTSNELWMDTDDWDSIITVNLTGSLTLYGVGSTDIVPRVLNYITNNSIVAGAGLTLDVELFDNGSGGDGLLITAIPEPMTIALLGLGGLFLRRRKR